MGVVAVHHSVMRIQEYEAVWPCCTIPVTSSAPVPVHHCLLLVGPGLWRRARGAESQRGKRKPSIIRSDAADPERS